MTILIDSGALSRIASSVDGLGVEIGVTGPASKYGAAQQFGLPGGRRWGRATVGPLPARAFLPVRRDGTVDLPAAIEREIRSTLEDAFGEALRDALARVTDGAPRELRSVRQALLRGALPRQGAGRLIQAGRFAGRLFEGQDASNQHKESLAAAQRSPRSSPASSPS